MKKILFFLLFSAIAQAEEVMIVKSAAFLNKNQDSLLKLIFTDGKTIWCAWQEKFPFLNDTLGWATAKVVMVIDEKSKEIGEFQLIVSSKKEVIALTNTGLALTSQDGFFWSIDLEKTRIWQGYLDSWLLKLIGKKKMVDYKKVKIKKEKDFLKLVFED